MFAAVFVRQMSGGQRKANDWNREHQADQSKRGGGMCAPVIRPLHGYGQHWTADDSEKIARHIEIEVGKAKGGIRIVRRQSDGPNGRRCFVLIHENAGAERAREWLASGVPAASEVLTKEGRPPNGCHPVRKRGNSPKPFDHTSQPGGSTPYLRGP